MRRELMKDPAKGAAEPLINPPSFHATYLTHTPAMETSRPVQIKHSRGLAGGLQGARTGGSKAII